MQLKGMVVDVPCHPNVISKIYEKKPWKLMVDYFASKILDRTEVSETALRTVTTLMAEGLFHFQNCHLAISCHESMYGFSDLNDLYPSLKTRGLIPLFRKFRLDRSVGRYINDRSPKYVDCLCYYWDKSLNKWCYAIFLGDVKNNSRRIGWSVFSFRTMTRETLFPATMPTTFHYPNISSNTERLARAHSLRALQSARNNSHVLWICFLVVDKEANGRILMSNPPSKDFREYSPYLEKVRKKPLTTIRLNSDFAQDFTLNIQLQPLHMTDTLSAKMTLNVLMLYLQGDLVYKHELLFDATKFKTIAVRYDDNDDSVLIFRFKRKDDSSYVTFDECIDRDVHRLVDPVDPDIQFLPCSYTPVSMVNEMEAYRSEVYLFSSERRLDRVLKHLSESQRKEIDIVLKNAIDRFARTIQFIMKRTPPDNIPLWLFQCFGRKNFDYNVQNGIIHLNKFEHLLWPFIEQAKQDRSVVVHDNDNDDKGKRKKKEDDTKERLLAVDEKKNSKKAKKSKET